MNRKLTVPSLAAIVLILAVAGTGCGRHSDPGSLVVTPQPSPIVGPGGASAGAPVGALTALITGSFVVPTPVPGGADTVSSSSGFITAYVPNGSWSESATGVQIVPIAGSGGAPKSTVATPNTVNSCSANQLTHTVVCVANGTDIYLINGDTGALSSTLTSGGTGSVRFSGGSCTTCGVVVDPTTNTAVLSLALGSQTGFQLLNLANNTLSAPFALSGNTVISETFGLDLSRHFILSPNEGAEYPVPADYNIVDISQPNSPKQYNLSNAATVFPNDDELDSAAIDSTGIVLATDEFTGNLFIADLTQAIYLSGSPGTWIAPNQLQPLPEFADNFGAGTTGIAVAYGAHEALLEDEFGTTAFGAIMLPSTSGSGTPSVQDWVVAEMPNTPDEQSWLMALDPHGLTAAFVEIGSNSKGMGLLMNDQRTYVALIDLGALLAAPRSPVHIVDPSYDLLANNVVQFIAIH